MIKNLFLFLLVFFMLSLSAQVKITEDQILSSCIKYFPVIHQAMEKVQISKMGVRESLGGFDSKISGKYDNRMDGYYDGKATDVEVSKPLQALNSKIFAGYRVSEGKYPSYEGKMNTLPIGEYRFGTSVSLWQNRDIDENRFKLQSAKFDLEKSKLKLKDVKLKTLKEASKAYWEWVAAGNRLRVFQNLLNTSLDREKGLRERIKKGDLASIYLSENKTYLLKRESQVLKATQSFREASLYLSLFYRDKNGEPIMLDSSRLPNFTHDFSPLNKMKLQQDMKLVADVNPTLKQIGINIQQNDNEILMGQNKLDPKIDLTYEVSQDQGTGDPVMEENEQRALLSFSIPIERRLGQGKIQKAKSKKRYNAKARQYLSEQLATTTQALYNNLFTMSKVILNTEEEIKLADKLQKAELQKFNSGASDFFVVFLRDENLANAELKYIKSNLKFKKSYAEYRYFTQRFDLTESP